MPQETHKATLVRGKVRAREGRQQGGTEGHRRMAGRTADALQALASGSRTPQQTWMESHEPVAEQAVEVEKKDDKMKSVEDDVRRESLEPGVPVSWSHIFWRSIQSSLHGKEMSTCRVFRSLGMIRTLWIGPRATL